MGRPGDVRAHERLVQRGRQGGEDRRVLGHQPEEVRAPRCERDHVDERQRAVRRPVQEVGPQRHRAAEVVGDHVRSGQPPVVEEVREHAPLRTEGDVAVRHRGRAVAEHVPQVDRVLGGERIGDRPPQGRRPRRAVAEHDGWTVATPTPADLAGPPPRTTRSTPVQHRIAGSAGPRYSLHAQDHVGLGQRCPRRPHRRLDLAASRQPEAYDATRDTISAWRPTGPTTAG